MASTKIGSFAGASSVTLTLGFPCKLLIVLGSFDGAHGAFGQRNYHSMAFALSNGTQTCQRQAADWNTVGFTGPRVRRTARPEVVSDITTAGISNNLATVTSVTATQVVITFSLGGSSGEIYHYLAIGGDDVEAAIGVRTVPTSTGNQAITGVGFQPDWYLTIGGEDGNSVDGAFWSLGMCDGTRQGVTAFQQFGNILGSSGTPGNVKSYQRTTLCNVVLDDEDGSVIGEATHVSMDADGFTQNWTTAPSAGQDYIWAAVRGIAAHVGSVTQPTSASTSAVSDLDCEPSAILFASYGFAAATTPQDGVRFSIGLSDATQNFCIWNGDDDNVSAEGNRRNVRTRVNDACTVHATPTGVSTGSVVASGTASGFLPVGGFQMTWDQADATQRQSLFMAFGGDADPDAPPELTVTIGDETGLNPLLETFRIQETLDAPDVAIFDIESAGSPFTRFSLGQTVFVTENNVRIFGGYVTGLRERGFTGPNSGDLVVEVQATSYELNAQRRVISDTFSASGSPGDSLRDVLTSLVNDYYDDVGVSLHPDQVDGPSVPTLTFDNVRGDQANRQIAESVGYLLAIDFENRLRAWAPGDIAAPDDYDADVNPELLTGDIEVEKQLQNGYANKVILVGDPIQVFGRTDTFNGDGAEDTFSLSLKPTQWWVVVRYEAANPSVPLYETIGTSPAFWSIDPVAQTITRTAGAPDSGDVLTITYNGLFIPEATAQDAGEIAALGLYEHVERITAVPENQSAQDYADALLAQKIASKDEIVTCQTRALGFHPGQTMGMEADERELTGDYLITQVETISESGSPRLVRKLTLAKSDNNEHDWRKVIQRWSQGSSSSSTGTSVEVEDGGGVSTALHEATHREGGIDELKLDDLGIPDDNTDLDVSTSRHGLVPKITGDDDYVLTKSGTSAVWAAPTGGGSPGAGGGLVSVSVLTSGTAATYTVPGGVTQIRARLVGGGGGGGGADGGSGQFGCGGGGGGGGYAEKVYAVSPSDTFTYTIGSAGNGGAAGNNAGQSGGDTLFDEAGSVVTAGGGGGGGSMAAGTTVNGSGAGNAAGTTSGGDVNIQPSAGGRGLRLSGGHGISGYGGNSVLGFGGTMTPFSGVGDVGVGYGAGGGGAAANTTTDRAGGAGTAGVILVEEYG